VRLVGKGAHGSMPENSVDPVVMAAETVLRLQTVISREVPSTATAVLTVGSIHAGDAANVIPGEAELQLNIRSYSASWTASTASSRAKRPPPAHPPHRPSPRRSTFRSSSMTRRRWTRHSMRLPNGWGRTRFSIPAQEQVVKTSAFSRPVPVRHCRTGCWAVPTLHCSRQVT
jgi:hypothetical protein